MYNARAQINPRDFHTVSSTRSTSISRCNSASRDPARRVSKQHTLGLIRLLLSAMPIGSYGTGVTRHVSFGVLRSMGSVLCLLGHVWCTARLAASALRPLSWVTGWDRLRRLRTHISLSVSAICASGSLSRDTNIDQVDHHATLRSESTSHKRSTVSELWLRLFWHRMSSSRIPALTKTRWRAFNGHISPSHALCSSWQSYISSAQFQKLQVREMHETSSFQANVRIDADMAFQAEATHAGTDVKPFRKQYRLFHATFAQFCYTGAQVAIAGAFINYVTETRVVNGVATDSSTASAFLAGAQGAFTLGRFFGSFLMKFTKPRLVFFAFMTLCM